MAGPYVTRDYEYAAQLEGTYNTDPGSWAGAHFFKSQSEAAFKRIVSRYDRDKDRDYAQRSVITTQKGRESGSFEFKGDIIPAGAGTPTKPDMDLLFQAHMGTVHLATAHTSTTSGSSGTTLELTAGGGAASGIAAKDLIAVDVDATYGYQVRQVVSISTDTVTVDRAFPANPASGRAVKTGATFYLTTANMLSLYLLEWLNGDNARHALGGAIAQKMMIDADYSQENPVVGVTFSGPGARVVTHSTSRPTPVTAGQPLVPTQGKAFVGSSLLDIVKASLDSDNGLELLESESGSLYPTAVKQTGNGGRYNMTGMVELLRRSGTVEGYYDNATSLTAYDVIIQHGITPGAIFAYRMPKFIPDVEEGAVEGLASVQMKGRLYGTSGDDELTLAFL